MCLITVLFHDDPDIGGRSECGRGDVAIAVVGVDCSVSDALAARCVY